MCAITALNVLITRSTNFNVGGLMALQLLAQLNIKIICVHQRKGEVIPSPQ